MGRILKPQRHLQGCIRPHDAHPRRQERRLHQHRLQLVRSQIWAGLSQQSHQPGHRPGGVVWRGGVGLIVAACFCWALDNNFTQKVSGGDPLRIAALKGLSAGSCNWLLGQAQWPTPQVLPAATLNGTFGYGVSLAAFVSALRYLGTNRTGAYFSLAAFVGASLSLVLFHQTITARFLGAALCMAAGVYLHLTENHEHQHTHEELLPE